MELGYDYCLKEECQQRCLKRLKLASVGVNKAADYYMRADEVMAPSVGPVPAAVATIGSDEGTERPSRRSPKADRPRTKTALERIQEDEAQLDAALERSYGRFSRGEMTALELDRERQWLIGAFNQRVMGENIRYRSRLRPSGRGVRPRLKRRRGSAQTSTAAPRAVVGLPVE